jgi:hypothetical protein
MFNTIIHTPIRREIVVKNPYNLQVGKEIFRVSTHRNGGDNHYRKIVKVGRKWVITENSYGSQEQVSMENLRADGGGYSSPATYYLSFEEYNEKLEKDKIWQRIRDKFFYSTPICSLEDLKKIAETLGIKDN